VSERWPAALRLDQAAEYCGLSVDTFKEVCTVAPIEFTKSSHGRRCLRTSLDEWLDSLDPKTAWTPTPHARRPHDGGWRSGSVVAASKLRGLRIFEARGKWYVYRRATGEVLIKGFVCDMKALDHHFETGRAHETDPDANREWYAKEWTFVRENAPLEVLIPMMTARHIEARPS
jgi:hypothetical protein